MKLRLWICYSLVNDSILLKLCLIVTNPKEMNCISGLVISALDYSDELCTYRCRDESWERMCVQYIRSSHAIHVNQGCARPEPNSRPLPAAKNGNILRSLPHARLRVLEIRAACFSLGTSPS